MHPKPRMARPGRESEAPLQMRAQSRRAAACLRKAGWAASPARHPSPPFVDTWPTDPSASLAANLGTRSQPPAARSQWRSAKAAASNSETRWKRCVGNRPRSARRSRLSPRWASPGPKRSSTKWFCRTTTCPQSKRTRLPQRKDSRAPARTARRSSSRCP